jgi:hypothetical protein
MYMPQRRNLSIGITINLDNYENIRLEVGGEVCGEGDAEDLITYLDTVLSRLGRGTPETAERVDSYRRRVLAPPAPVRAPAGVGSVVLPPGGMPGQPASAPAPSSTVPAPASSTPTAPNVASTLPSAPESEIPAAGTESISRPAEGGTVPTRSPAIKKSPIPGPVSLPKKEAPPAVKTEVAPPAMKKEPASVVTKKEMVPVVAARKEAPATATIPKSPSALPAESGEVQKGEEFSCERCGEPITPVQRKLSRMFQNKDLCKKCLQQL